MDENYKSFIDQNFPIKKVYDMNEIMDTLSGLFGDQPEFEEIELVFDYLIDRLN